MPVYMDRHYVEGATRHAVADAHQKDLALQEKYDVKFLTYWFDETRCTAFCLIEAPNRETIERAHNEAHGLIPNEVLEVDPAVVEAFLGRIKDPPSAAAEKTDGVAVDAGFRAIMFTDLKDSTRMTMLYGDAKALHLVHVHNALIRNCLNTCRGREIKHTGDGLMASFSSVPDAVECAVAVQKAFAAYNQKHSEAPLYVRVGVSAGEPIEEHGDLFGKSVQLAARLCTRAEPGRILIDQVVLDQSSGKNLPISDLGEVTLKGFDHAVRVYEIEWMQT
ncbi:MAG TPA: nickel-binding protein [Candidatus Binatia bacterium]|nr:nickel-binding protein [Candidatus Binatia bacterium]